MSTSTKVNLRLSDLDMTPAKVTIDAAFFTASAVSIFAANNAFKAVEVDAAERITKGRNAEWLATYKAFRDIPFVSFDGWAKEWVKPLNAALVAAGYETLTASSKASGLKAIILALSRGWAPADNLNLTSAREAAKEWLKGREDMPKEAAPSESAIKAKADKSAKEAKAHALALCDNDGAFADKLKLAAGPYRAAFEQWFDMFNAAIVAAKG